MQVKSEGDIYALSHSRYVNFYCLLKTIMNILKKTINIKQSKLYISCYALLYYLFE